jgi:hypothetical protein
VKQIPIPTDELIFFRGVGIPPTSWWSHDDFCITDVYLRYFMGKYKRESRTKSWTNNWSNDEKCCSSENVAIRRCWAWTMVRWLANPVFFLMGVSEKHEFTMGYHIFIGTHPFFNWCIHYFQWIVMSFPFSTVYLEWYGIMDNNQFPNI